MNTTENPTTDAANGDICSVLLSQIEREFGPAYDDEDEEINGGDAVEYICGLIPAIRQALHVCPPRTEGRASVELAVMLTDDGTDDALNALMDALLTTAIEGGSAGWLRQVLPAADVSVPATADPVRSDGMPWYSEAFTSGVSLTLEPDDFPGESEVLLLDREAGLRGLRLLCEGGRCRRDIVCDLIANGGAADADTADAWLQLAAFGDLVYG